MIDCKIEFYNFYQAVFVVTAKRRNFYVRNYKQNATREDRRQVKIIRHKNTK